MYHIKVVALVVVLAIGNCSGQSQCEPPTETDLSGVIALIIATGDSAVSELIVVDLKNYTIVCRAAGEKEGMLRQVSVVVEYTCTGHADCPTGTVTEQIETQCNSGTWTNRVQGDTDNVRLTSPEATLTTPGRDDCASCLSPGTADSAGAPDPDTLNHCVACNSQCEGLNRCTGIGSSDCCNYLNNSLCVDVCPEPFTTPNSDNICDCPLGRSGFNCSVLVECGNLSHPDNGMVTLSGIVLNSVAIYTCDTGYDLVGNNNRTCLATGNWSGNEPTCVEVDCGGLTDPPNGAVSMTGTKRGSIATYTCNDGYALIGDTLRTCGNDGLWSAKEPTCTACTVGNCLICSNKPEECTVCEANYEAVDGTCKCEVDGCAVCDAGKCDECEGSMRFDEASVSCVTQDDGGDKDDGGLPAGAIAGIILALIVMALILALTAALIGYFAKRHWDKVHTRSHNIPSEQPKESHENPLYVGPETALEGVDKGTAVLIGGNGVSPSEGGVSNGVSNGSE